MGSKGIVNIIAEFMEKIKDVLFLSKEEKNSIEHVDMPYDSFLRVIENAMNQAYKAGYEDGAEGRVIQNKEEQVDGASEGRVISNATDDTAADAATE